MGIKYPSFSCPLGGPEVFLGIGKHTTEAQGFQVHWVWESFSWKAHEIMVSRQVGWVTHSIKVTGNESHRKLSSSYVTQVP